MGERGCIERGSDEICHFGGLGWEKQNYGGEDRERIVESGEQRRFGGDWFIWS